VPIGKAKKYQDRYTLSSTTPVGTNTMFLQIGKRYTPFLVLHQFFHTLPIIRAQVVVKHFCKVQDGGLKKEIYPAPQH
jgi:hypothetical protein